MEILTLDDVAKLLKMTRNQVYTMTRTRSQERMDVPLPVLRINGNLRFRRNDVEVWVETLAKGNAREV
jgi:predicted DNA-binding transcriptional regulator AlpA